MNVVFYSDASTSCVIVYNCSLDSIGMPNASFFYNLDCEVTLYTNFMTNHKVFINKTLETTAHA